MKLARCTLPGMWGANREVDPRRLRNSTARRVTGFGDDREAYWAFVPRDLPPDTQWDNELVLVLADIVLEAPLVSEQMVQKRYLLSHPTARNGFQRLDDMGIPREKTGKQRNRLYSATAVVNAVE